jgi:hypothetical protein
MIGFRPGKGGKKGVVDIDDLVLELADELLGEDLLTAK